MNMAALQAQVARFVEKHGLDAPVAARVLDLCSEAGELAKEVLKSTDYGHEPFRPGENWRAELADALFVVMCLANSTGVDLEDALKDGLGSYERRLEATGDASSGRPLG